MPDRGWVKTFLLTLGAGMITFAGLYLSEHTPPTDKIVLHGACQFDQNHSYTRALQRFAQLVDEYYSGPVEVEFVLHANSELGNEKDYFGYMSIGAVVDYAVVAPSHVSTFSRKATIMDVPFLFKDTSHYLAAIDAGVFADIETDVLNKADVLILGYGGGESRHIFGRRPVRNMQELAGFQMRVMGSPIQSRMFAALGATPTVISSDEIYNAIQTGVIDGAENSVAVIDLLKWYEVAPEISLTSVSYIVRPFFFNAKRFRSFPGDLQEAIRRAGAEAMAFERKIEMQQETPTLAKLQQEGKMQVSEFSDREQLLELAAPVKSDFARQIGAETILESIEKLAP